MSQLIVTDATRPRPSRWPWLLGGVIILLLIGIGGFLYTELQIEREASLQSIAELEQELTSTSVALEQSQVAVSQLRDELDSTNQEFDTILGELRRERNRNEEFAAQIQNLAGTVGTLDRLSQIDKELLQKYSRVYFLNENYRPARMTPIPSQWVLAGRSEQYFLTDAWPFLQDMLRAAERDGIDLRILSAFRSFDEQTELKQQFTRQYGSGANAFSADQGYSEHQLGTAIDVVDPATGGTFVSFAQTAAYRWLKDNAYRYGFILSYPEGNEFYIYEPWHWRFVGRALATDLHQANEYFYDWDQRTIDTYLINLFD